MKLIFVPSFRYKNIVALSKFHLLLAIYLSQILINELEIIDQGGIADSFK